jgi:hypothetical protein
MLRDRMAWAQNVTLRGVTRNRGSPRADFSHCRSRSTRLIKAIGVSQMEAARAVMLS